MTRAEKYRTLAAELRERAKLPSQLAHRDQILRMAAHFELCAAEAEQTQGTVTPRN